MKFKKLLFFFSIIILIGCENDSIEWLNGRWEGVGCQLDLEENNTWSINLEVSVDEQLYKVDYPSLECYGKWELIEYTSNRAVFDEIILRNTNDCIERGTVIITKVDNNHISFSYYIAEEEEEVLAFSTLKRKLN